MVGAPQRKLWKQCLIQYWPMTICAMLMVWKLPARTFLFQVHLAKCGNALLKLLTNCIFVIIKMQNARRSTIQRAKCPMVTTQWLLNKLLYGQVDLNISCAPCQGSINFSTFIGLLNVAILTPNDVINQAKILCYLNSHTHRFHRRKNSFLILSWWSICQALITSNCYLYLLCHLLKLYFMHNLIVGAASRYFNEKITESISSAFFIHEWLLDR